MRSVITIVTIDLIGMDAGIVVLGVTLMAVVAFIGAEFVERFVSKEDIVPQNEEEKPVPWLRLFVEPPLSALC